MTVFPNKPSARQPDGCLSLEYLAGRVPGLPVNCKEWKTTGGLPRHWDRRGPLVPDPPSVQPASHPTRPVADRRRSVISRAVACMRGTACGFFPPPTPCFAPHWRRASYKRESTGITYRSNADTLLAQLCFLGLSLRGAGIRPFRWALMKKMHPFASNGSKPEPAGEDPHPGLGVLDLVRLARHFGDLGDPNSKSSAVANAAAMILECRKWE